MVCSSYTVFAVLDTSSDCLALAFQNPRPKSTFLALAWLGLALAQAKASSNKCDKWGLRVYTVKKGLENAITKVDAGLTALE